MINRKATTANKLTAPLLRYAHVVAFVTYLRQLGAPVDSYLRSQKLPILCEDPNAFIPLLRFWSFFDTASRNEVLELGWLVGAHVGDHQLNISLLRKLETAPTLLQALRRFVQMANSDATHLEMGIEGRRDRILFYSRYSGMSEEPGYEIAQAYRLGIFLDVVRFYLGRSWVPDEIGIESTHIPTGAKECFPGSRILTQQPAGYIVVPRYSLHQAPPISDMKVGRSEIPQLIDDHTTLRENPDYVSSLKAVLKTYLCDGYVSEQFAAELMNTSVRTLTRRLSACHLTYGELIDGVRFSSAKKLLRNRDMRIGDVAHTVGFRDQGDFTRMFQRVGGLSPKEFRNTTRH